MKSGNGNEMRDNSRHLDINGSAAHSYVSNQYIPEQTVLGEMAQPCYGGASAGPGACYAYEAVGNEYNESTKYPSGYTVVCSEATGSGSGIGMEPNRRLAPSGSDNLGMSSTQANPPRSETRPKRKTVLRAAGGETWEDPTLLDWDPSRYRR